LLSLGTHSERSIWDCTACASSWLWTYFFQMPSAGGWAPWSCVAQGGIPQPQWLLSLAIQQVQTEVCVNKGSTVDSKDKE
jgi:hypothetical protein